jgi:hypothetical protein
MKQVLKKTPQIIALFPLSFFALFTIYVSFRKTNIPIMDDYDSILLYLIEKPTSFMGSLIWILKPHNEHLMVIPNLIIQGTHFFFGDINFRFLVIVGLFLLICLALVIANTQKKIFGVDLRIFSSLTILNLGLGTVLIWPMGLLQHVATCLFSFLTILAFNANSKRAVRVRYFLLSVSCLTGGGSLVLIPILAIGNVVKKAFKWRTFFLFSVLLIFTFAAFGANSRHQFPSVSSINLFLYFLGNPFSVLNAPLFGLIFLLLFIVLVVSLKSDPKQISKNLIFLQVLGFNLSMGIFASISRQDYGSTYGSEAKYFLYSALCWVSMLTILYCQTDVRYSRISQVTLILFGLLIFSLSVYSYSGPILELMKIDWIIYPETPEMKAQKILSEASRLGIYIANGKVRNFWLAE